MMAPRTARKLHVKTSEGPKSENLAQLSGVITSKVIDILLHMIDAGASNLMQGYASVIIVSDLMHSAGLLTDDANTAISALATIITGISTAEGIVGIFTGANNAFQPQLKTRVDQTINEKGETTEKRTTEGAGRAAQALSGLIPELATAAGA
jgi:hypothetical protein